MIPPLLVSQILTLEMGTFQGGRSLNSGPTEAAGTAGTKEDLSASFALQWDEDWIFVGARVTDNVMMLRGGLKARSG